MDKETLKRSQKKWFKKNRLLCNTDCVILCPLCLKWNKRHKISQFSLSSIKKGKKLVQLYLSWWCKCKEMFTDHNNWKTIQIYSKYLYCVYEYDSETSNLIFASRQGFSMSKKENFSRKLHVNRSPKHWLDFTSSVLYSHLLAKMLSSYARFKRHEFTKTLVILTFQCTHIISRVYTYESPCWTQTRLCDVKKHALLV